MNVLVTGISGFAGSYIARHLCRTGFTVTGIYRRNTEFLKGILSVPGLNCVRTDLLGIRSLVGPFQSVVHTAATSPAPGISCGTIVHDNVLGTLALIDAAQGWGTERLIFFSSLSVHGAISSSVVDEATPIVNPDAYGASKYICELILAEKSKAMATLALRLPGVLGPGAHRNWLSGVAERLVAGAAVPAFNLDSPFNNAVHVEDLARLTSYLLTQRWHKFEAIVLGARGSITIQNAIERLAQALGVPPRTEVQPSLKSAFTLSSERAIAHWGYDPLDIGAMIDRYGGELRMKQ